MQSADGAIAGARSNSSSTEPRATKPNADANAPPAAKRKRAAPLPQKLGAMPSTSTSAAAAAGASWKGHGDGGGAKQGKGASTAAILGTFAVTGAAALGAARATATKKTESKDAGFFCFYERSLSCGCNNPRPSTSRRESDPHTANRFAQHCCSASRCISCRGWGGGGGRVGSGRHAGAAAHGER